MIFPDEKNSPVFRKVPTANMVEAQITAWQADSGIFTRRASRVNPGLSSS